MSWLGRAWQRLVGRPAVPTPKELGEAVAGYSEHVKGKAEEANKEILRTVEVTRGLLKQQRKEIWRREDVLSKLLRAMQGETEL